MDTEFIAVPGERVVPVALVAHELRSGRQHHIFLQADRARECPLPLGEDILYVASSAQAEWSVFLALGWSLPVHVLDLFVEFRALTNGLTDAGGESPGTSLLAALVHFNLSLPTSDKIRMRELILRGGPFSPNEEAQILDYCQEDVEALRALLPCVLAQADLAPAVLRGRYTKAVAQMEFTGIPIDTATLTQMRRYWLDLKTLLVQSVEEEHRYGVYEGRHWRQAGFTLLLERLHLLDVWPRTQGGQLVQDDETLKQMAKLYPALEPLRQVRSTLTHLNEIKLTVGTDGRNRVALVPFRSVTGRNYPASSRFVFGPSTWLRSLIQPEPGCSVAYIDYVSAEFGIAAALSEDAAMIAAYSSGDVYMSFAIAAGEAPAHATKLSHPKERDVFKTVTLAVQYGQTAKGLASNLGKSVWEAQALLDIHRQIYARYWQWSEWMTQRAYFDRRLKTVFGWPLHITSRTKHNTIVNFPMQAHGAEILRWACVLATEAGVEVQAPVQDALLVGGQTSDFEDVISITKRCMHEASALVLGGFGLQTEVAVVHAPERYTDKRGVRMWETVQQQLRQLQEHQL